MRQLAAILGDSLREAIDRKSLLVLLVLSLLPILFCFGLSFERESLEQVLTRQFDEVRTVSHRRWQISQPLAHEAPSVEPIAADDGWPPSVYGGLEATVRFPDPKQLDALADKWRDAQKQAGESPPDWGTRAKSVVFLEERFREMGWDRVAARVRPEDPTMFEIAVLSEHPATLQGAFGASFLFGAFHLPLRRISVAVLVTGIQITLAQVCVGFFGMLVALLSCAGFVPNMLQKGTLDLVLARPLSRSTLLIGKYLGGLWYVALIAAFLIGGCWVGLAARSGYTAPAFLLTIPSLLLTFAALHAVSTLVGVMTRSSGLAALLACGTWGVSTVVATGRALRVVRCERPSRRIPRADPRRARRDVVGAAEDQGHRRAQRARARHGQPRGAHAARSGGRAGRVRGPARRDRHHARVHGRGPDDHLPPVPTPRLLRVLGWARSTTERRAGRRRAGWVRSIPKAPKPGNGSRTTRRSSTPSRPTSPTTACPTSGWSTGGSRRHRRTSRSRAKFPRSVVHCGEKAQPDGSKVLVPEHVGEDTARFLDAMARLGERCGPLVLQFPYFNRSGVHVAAAVPRTPRRVPRRLPAEFRYGVEVRNKAWVKKPLLEILRRHGAALVLVDLLYMPHPAELEKDLDVVTTDFVYGRLIGDRKAVEEKTDSFDHIVIDQSRRLDRWAELLAKLLDEIPDAWIYANNHYAGHGPATIRDLAERVQEARRTR